MRVRDAVFYILIIIAAFILCLLVVVPIATMVFSISLHELFVTICDKEVLQSIVLTFECALYATGIAIILGIPLSYIFTFIDFPLKKLLITMFDIPMIIPHSASGIALLFVFGSGYLSYLFRSLNIEIIGTKVGIVIAMTFVSIPYFINSVNNGFAAIDTRFMHVARTLGATHRQCFTHVLLPLSIRSIVIGAVMMWGRGISEFGAVMILTYHPMVAPVMLYDRFTAYGLTGSKHIAAILIIFCIIFFICIRIALTYREKHAYSA